MRPTLIPCLLVLAVAMSCGKEKTNTIVCPIESCPGQVCILMVDGGSYCCGGDGGSCLPGVTGDAGDGGDAGMGSDAGDAGKVDADAGNLSDGGDAGDILDADGGDAGSRLPGLYAMGHTIVDGAGKVVNLHGVNRSGTEYECVQGNGIFDGPNDSSSIDAIAAWNANAIRIPLNEDCWLAINGVASDLAGAAYQAAIDAYVQLVLAKGLTPILELHWSAPGATLAMGQAPMPDEDHAPAFWNSVASVYGSDPRVVLELFNEPYPDSSKDSVAAWTCWQQGGTCEGVSYTVAGMQELVTAVRAAGATNLLLLGGVQYANSLSQWESYVPEDPQDNLGAAWHLYSFNGCNSTTCFSSESAPVLTMHPIVATEIGENDCGHTFIDATTVWLDANSSGYLAWAWNADYSCSNSALVTDYHGTPTPYGAGYRNHLLGL